MTSGAHRQRREIPGTATCPLQSRTSHQIDATASHFSLLSSEKASARAVSWSWRSVTLHGFFCSKTVWKHGKSLKPKICGNIKMLKWINERISAKRSASGFIPALGVSLNTLNSRADFYFLVSAHKNKLIAEKRHSSKNQLLCNLIGLWSPM